MAGLLTILALVTITAPLGSPRRTIGEVFHDVKSGKQPATTRLQKVCVVLALLLLAVQVVQSLR
jgi:hypothetical protein